MKLWLCMVSMKWAHNPLNGCIQGPGKGKPDTGERKPKATHPNCGWYLMEKETETEAEEQSNG